MLCICIRRFVAIAEISSGSGDTNPVPVKVLIVEDDLPTLELMNEVLSSLKVDVRELHDSSEAAVLVNRERFDGIFVDLQMPKMDGFELARHIRASTWNKSAPIIIVTAQDDPKTMQKAFACGAAASADASC